MTPEKEKAYRDKLEEAVLAGYKALQAGRSSLDAVEIAIRMLEDSPLFNAGKGAVLTSDGRTELDSSIMDGRTRAAGSVAGTTTTRHPISLARKVMEDSPHVMLSGSRADKLARDEGL